MNSVAAGMNVRRRERAELKPPLLVDGVIVGVATLLVAGSLIMIYSTTAIPAQEKFGDSLHYVRRQVAAATIGLLAMVALSRVPLDFLRRYSPVIFFCCTAALLLTLIPGMGQEAGGAHRWIKLGPVQVQPGEFMKVGFVVFLAGFFSRHEGSLTGFVGGVVKPTLFLGAVSVLLLLQPDFGSVVIIAVVSLSMAAVTGVRLRYLFACGSILLPIGAGLIVFSPYRMNRLLAFLSPWSDTEGKGYQLIQSLIAVGSGHLTGVGLGASQQKLFFLPAAHTDFIFAVIAEELGFIGATTLVLLFAFLFWRGLALAQRVAHDTFAFSLSVGLTLLIVVPAFLNVGVVTGLLPTKGLVLPLVGYGGSSMVASLVTVGLLLSVARSYYGQRS